MSRLFSEAGKKRKKSNSDNGGVQGEGQTFTLFWFVYHLFPLRSEHIHGQPDEYV
jgi:hypothetical protein